MWSLFQLGFIRRCCLAWLSPVFADGSVLFFCPRPSLTAIQNCLHVAGLHSAREEKQPPAVLPLSMVALGSMSIGPCSVALAEAASATALPASMALALKVCPPACFFFLQVSG